MRIAVFHNFMDNIGGAEIVALTLARGLGADLYTTNFDAERIRSIGFGDVVPRIVSIGRVSARAPFRQQKALWLFRKLDLGRQYGFYIIAGDWAMSGAVNNRPNLWYVHSPLNELWAFKDFVKKEVVPPWQRPVYECWVRVNRSLSRRYARGIGVWVANSENVRARIKRYYGAEATVIHPPVDMAAHPSGDDHGYWLSVNRLFRNKRIELQLSAFARLPEERLIIVGSYEKGAAQFERYRDEIERLRPANVEIRHWVPADELRELYAHCRAFITTSKDEDFGMAPVEAMASGKPVIAPNEGGYRETVIDGTTGMLVDDMDENKLAEAVRKMGAELKDLARRDYYRGNCQAQARRFGISVFMAKIRDLL